jgi:hypothetical protein
MSEVCTPLFPIVRGVLLFTDACQLWQRRAAGAWCRAPQVQLRTPACQQPGGRSGGTAAARSHSAEARCTGSLVAAHAARRQPAAAAAAQHHGSGGNS